MFEYFLNVIFMVSELAIGVFQVLTKLLHFFLDLYVELFAFGNVLFATVNNLHKSRQLAKHVTVKIYCRRNDYNRVTLGESDNCDGITGRPLTCAFIDTAVSRSAVKCKLTGKQTEDHTVFPVVKLHVEVELTRFKIGIVTG